MDAVGNDAEGGGNDDSKLRLLTAVSIYTIGLVVVQDPGQGFRIHAKVTLLHALLSNQSKFQHGTHNYLEDNQTCRWKIRMGRRPYNIGNDDDAVTTAPSPRIPITKT